MKNKLSIIVMVIMTTFLYGCCLVHDWQDADCVEPKHCKTCGKTEGEALGHEWIDATCTDAKTCSVCGATEGEAKGHIWSAATCQKLKTCSVCGATDGEYTDHVWLPATCLKPERCDICGITTGTTTEHEWVRASYNSSKYCSKCGIVEGDVLEPAFEKRGYEFTLEKDKAVDYVTLANADKKEITGKATVIDYRKYCSDANHSAKDGYEWREVTVKFEMPTGCRTMWGYTDTFIGLEEYTQTDFITYADGTRESVLATEDYEYEWVEDVCVSKGSIAVRVPEDYPYLVFYICSSEYEDTQKVDPRTKFMKMD